MKREREETAVSIFFDLDECIEILCLPVPSPRFIAQLLQLSKRTRLLVWRFLINPEKGLHEWVEDFCHSLWQDTNKGPCKPIELDYAQYPVFVSPGLLPKEEETYYVGQMVYKPKDMYLVADIFKCPDLPVTRYKYYMKRTIRKHIPVGRVFNWFIVARALDIRCSRMIHQHTMNLLNVGGIVYMADNDLCIH